ncbi:hypothetical protein K7I13_03250 [Brucepastera parasyntrophica]|uniref:hypothetical protein n=1 Tax=Brucepastera parasyntrophica TaxID=2880008 RepID=UPI00210A49D0|nr:hypothetical protein [Brucepastera parasyntrophica]ULQ60339.1 hypothetical protein K7I13_03250 [Brucepastera parasyntrophica]
MKKIMPFFIAVFSLCMLSCARELAEIKVTNSSPYSIDFRLNNYSDDSVKTLAPGKPGFIPRVLIP